MPTEQYRRPFVSQLGIAGVAAMGGLAGAGLGGGAKALAAEPPPETTTVRLAKQDVICFARQYVCEQLLRAEGFVEIRYVDATISSKADELSRGKYDFAAALSVSHIVDIDKGAPITIVSGVHRRRHRLAFLQRDSSMS